MSYRTHFFLLTGLFLLMFLILPSSPAAAAAAKPDLVLTRVQTTGRTMDTNERVVWLTVANKGTALVESFKIKIEWLNKNGAVLDSCTEGSPADSPLVPVYGTVDFVAGACGSDLANNARDDRRSTLRDQSYKVRLTLDPEKKIAESNERNNTVTKNLGLPNPVISSLVSSYYLADNEQANPWASIDLVNLGQDELGSIILKVQWLDKDNTVMDGCDIIEGPLKVNAVASFGVHCGESTEAVKLHHLAHKIRVTIDPQNKVAQAIEKNNVYTKDRVLPDLTASLTFDGRTKNPLVVINNAGKDNVPNDSFWVAYDWFGLNGKKLGGCVMEVEKLLYNKFYSETSTFCGNKDTYAQAAKFRVSLNVGSGLVVAPDFAESNENNNVVEKVVPGRFRITGKLTIPKLSSLADYGRVAIGDVETETPAPQMSVDNQADNLVGADRDEHGCIPSAGYSWCEVKSKCLRIWEEECIATGTPVVSEPTTEVVPTTPTLEVNPPAPIITPPVETPAPAASTPVITPPTVATPAESTTVAGDRLPSYDVELTDDGRATFNIKGKINYYGTYKGCEGPRYFDPVIIAWGQVDSVITPPAKDFSATHKYLVRNPEYDITVLVTNSCFQKTVKRFTVRPKL